MNQVEYINVENFSNAMKEVGKIIANTMNAIINVFKEIAENISYVMQKTIFSKKVSRKRFIKLLMSYGIQRNEANKIASYYHKKDGYYLLINVYMEVKKCQKKQIRY